MRAGISVMSFFLFVVVFAGAGILGKGKLGVSKRKGECQ